MGYRSVLSNTSFLFLWVSQILSQVADKIFFVVLIALITEHSPSHAMVSLAMIALGAPSALFGVPAGILVDRADKRLTMIATNALRAVLIACTPWLAGSPWAMVLLAFVISTCSQPFAPAEAATIPMVVPRQGLMSANALFSTTLVASIIVGFTLAEPMLARVGTAWAAGITAAMYAVAGLSDVGVRYPPQPQAPARSLSLLLDELREGWQYIRRERSVRGAIARLVTLFAMFAAMSVMAILFARQQLHAPFSWFLAVAGVGMGIGSTLVGRWGIGMSRRVLVSGGFAVAGLALGALAWANASTVVPAFVLAAVIGAASAAVVIPLQTQLQEAVPETMRGKVFGAQNMATNVATAIPIAGVGILSDAVGVRTVFVLLAACMLAAAALGLRPERPA